MGPALQIGPMDATLALAYLVIAVAAAVLLYYLATYVRDVLAEPNRHRWWYVGIGIAATGLYGVSGLLDVLTDVAWFGPFNEGATLFVILFLALGIRSMYLMRRGGGRADRLLPRWTEYVVIGLFVVAWWTGFLTNRSGWLLAVETVGWVGASVYALVYALRTVSAHEGTSIAAVTRHLFPAVLSFTVVVFAQIVGSYTGEYADLVTAVRVVGTVLVGAFLFTTAVAIRQQSGEVSRKYDPTTWRSDETL